MKKLMTGLVLALVLATSAQAQSWKSLAFEGNATKVGAVYAAVCNACMDGDYNNDSGNWACTDAPNDGQTPCWDALKEAAVGNYMGE